jgi:hypothetical protein
LGLVGEDRNAKLLYLAVTSRLLGRPVSVVVKGPSSAGKSYTVETVLRTFPDSAYYALSSMSERSLAYSEEPLQHRILVIHEASGMASDFGTYLVRTLLSEGHVRYETVEKTQDGLKSRLIEREGPTGLLTTTTWAGLHPENETRLLSLTVKDDKEQTKAILRSLADQANGNRPAEPDLEAWHAFQTWLELAGEREVTIPYARAMADLANPSAVRLRRDFGTVLSLIKVHAILHQKNRKRVNRRIVAEWEDYRAVYSLVTDLVNEGAQTTVKKIVRETVEAIDSLDDPGGEGVQVIQVAKHLDIDKSSAWRRVRVAMREGYVVNLEVKKGKPARLKLGDPLPDDTPVLPSPDEVAKATQGGGYYYPSGLHTTVQPSDSSEGPDLWKGSL